MQCIPPSRSPLHWEAANIQVSHPTLVRALLQTRDCCYIQDPLHITLVSQDSSLFRMTRFGIGSIEFLPFFNHIASPWISQTQLP